MGTYRALGPAAVSMAGLAFVLSVGAGGVSAATTLTLDPDVARPGTRVTIDNACLGVTPSPAAELQAAFVSLAKPDLVPPDPDVPRAVARNTGTYRYVVIVPKLLPGKYDIRLECLPGDWRTNTAEGGAVTLTVRPDLPTTSTADTVATQQSSTHGFEQLLLVGLATASWLVASRRFRRARRS